MTSCQENEHSIRAWNEITLCSSYYLLSLKNSLLKLLKSLKNSLLKWLAAQVTIVSKELKYQGFLMR